jgi:hypothetical protein
MWVREWNEREARAETTRTEKINARLCRTAGEPLSIVEKHGVMNNKDDERIMEGIKQWIQS